jgi:hypothetical protein
MAFAEFHRPGAFARGSALLTIVMAGGVLTAGSSAHAADDSIVVARPWTSTRSIRPAGFAIPARSI